MDGYLSKPIHSGELCEMVGRYLLGTQWRHSVRN